MSGNLVIEKASENEISVIHQLAEEIWRAYYPQIVSVEQVDYMLGRMYSASALKKQFQDNHFFYLAYIDHSPVGYFSYSEIDKGKFFLHKLYIVTVEHHTGIGSNIINYLLDLLPKKNEIRLTVNRMNFKAINFYFKNGFTIEYAKDFDIENGFFMNDFVMLRRGNA